MNKQNENHSFRHGVSIDIKGFLKKFGLENNLQKIFLLTLFWYKTCKNVLWNQIYAILWLDLKNNK